MTRKMVTEELSVEGSISEIIATLEIYMHEIKKAHKNHDLPTVMQGFGGLSNLLRKAPRWQLVGIEKEPSDGPIFFGPVGQP